MLRLSTDKRSVSIRSRAMCLLAEALRVNLLIDYWPKGFGGHYWSGVLVSIRTVGFENVLRDVSHQARVRIY